MGLLSIFDSKEKKNRLSHMLNLLAVACADGVLEQSEIDLFLQIGKRIGVSESELQRVVANPGSVKLVAPDNDADRIALLYDMVLMMMINGDIDDNEVLFCKSTAVRLGFNPKVIDLIVQRVIELVKSGVENDKAVETLINEAQN